LDSKSLTSSPTRSLEPPCLQIDVHDVSNLRFGRSRYGWKAKEIILPLPQSHGQLKSESAAILKTRQISRNFLVLHHLFWADGPCIELESTRDAS
jgi:hypothetical protein